MMKTERKILDRIEKGNLKKISFDSSASKREFNAANSLIKKGFLKFVSEERSSWCSNQRTCMGNYKWIHSINLVCEVIKTK